MGYKKYFPAAKDGVYKLKKYPGTERTETVDTYCDMTKDGGGWSMVRPPVRLRVLIHLRRRAQPGAQIASPSYWCALECTGSKHRH